VNQKELQTTFSHPTPELPVVDVERAQQHYRDALGFEIRWLYPGKEIGAVWLKWRPLKSEVFSEGIWIMPTIIHNYQVCARIY
jgi:Bleomycin resistance protein-like N-terminal